MQRFLLCFTITRLMLCKKKVCYITLLNLPDVSLSLALPPSLPHFLRTRYSGCNRVTV